MTHVLGDLIPYAVAVGLSPLPLIALLFLFNGKAARPGGIAFVLARLVVVFAVAAVVAFVAELIPEQGGTSLFLALLRVVVGIGLMVWGVITIARRPGRGVDASPPAWMSSIENASVTRAAGLGVIVSAANVKELAFGIGAGLAIGSAHLDVGSTLAAAAGYAVLCCLALIVAVVAFLVSPQRMHGPLDTARTWLVRNYTVIVGIVLLVIGAVLVGNGVDGLG